MKWMRSPEEVIPRWEPSLKTPSPSIFKNRNRLRVSDLEELHDLSDDDYLLMTDTSAQKSMKVKLSTLKRFIKS